MIVIPTWNRLDYLKQVIEGLKQTSPTLRSKYELLFCMEPCPEVESYVNSLKPKDLGVLKINIYKNGRNIGVTGNPYKATMLAFEKHKADWVVFLEDDDVPQADLLELCKFYESCEIDHGLAYPISFGFHAIRPDGKDDKLIKQVNYFWGIGYMINYRQWELYFRDYWIGNGHGAVNDFANNGGYSLMPDVSRIRNIGVNGAHCNQDVYNKKQLDKFPLPSKYTNFYQFRIENHFYTDTQPY